MPLMINGKAVQSKEQNISKLISHEEIKVESSRLLEQSVQSVESKRLLYINQREYAATLPDDEHVQILGTEDATTCHIVILRHTGSGAVCLAHCDGCDTEAGIKCMISLIKELSLGKPDGRIDLHLAGGFLDPKGESERLSNEIVGIFIEQKEPIHLRTAAITGLNDTLKDGVHFPIIYGLGINVRTGELFRATFPDKGPDMDVRSACHFGDCKEMMNVYDYRKGRLVIGPYSWKPWKDVQQWLFVPNAFIRRYLSTSPEQEPEYFEDHVRASLKVLHEHPKPSITLFSNGKPWLYQKEDDGRWTKLL